MKKFPCSIYVLHLSTKTQYKPAYSQLFQYFPSCLQHLPCCPKCRSVAFWRQLLRLQQDLDRFLKKRERKIVNWKYRRFWKRTFTFSSFVQVERLSTYLLSINLQKETKCDNSPTLRTNWLKHSALIESSLSLKASAKSTTVTTCSQFSLCWDWTSKQKIISTRMWTTVSTFSFYYYWYQKLDRRFSAKACNNLVLSSYLDKLVIGLASKFRHVFNSS